MVAGTAKLRIAFELAEIGVGLRDKDRVDTEAGVIHDVKVAGFESRNKAFVLGLSREEFGDAIDQTYGYTRGAYERAVGLYEGAKVYLSHPKFRYTETGQRVPIPDSRSDDDLLGWLSNVRVMESGVYADFHYLKTHPFTPRLIEIADRNPSKLAMSHEAMFGNPALIGGRVYLQEILKVDAVALVTAEPGTTGGLFESVAESTFKAAECTCGKCKAGMAIECGGEGSGKPGPCPGSGSGSSGGAPGPRTKAVATAVRGRRSQSDLAIRNLKMQASGQRFASQSDQAIANLNTKPNQQGKNTTASLTRDRAQSTGGSQPLKTMPTPKTKAAAVAHAQKMRTQAATSVNAGRRSQSDLAVRNLQMQKATGGRFPSQTAQAIANLQSSPGPYQTLAQKRAASGSTEASRTAARTAKVTARQASHARRAAAITNAKQRQNASRAARTAGHDDPPPVGPS
jgi:hypothetical protein